MGLAHIWIGEWSTTCAVQILSPLSLRSIISLSSFIWGRSTVDCLRFPSLWIDVVAQGHRMPDERNTFIGTPLSGDCLEVFDEALVK